MSKKIGMKKWAVLTLLLMCLTLLAGVPAASAAEGSSITLQLKVGSPNMTINGVSQPIDNLGTAPVVSGGTTYVPIKAIVEALEGSIQFVSTEKKITVMGAKTIDLWVDRTNAVVNGQRIALDKGPYISSGRTLVPLRFVANNLGCQVQWDGPTQTITINYTLHGSAPVDPGTTPPGDPGTTPPVDPGTTTPAAPAADFSGIWQLVVEGEDMGTSVLVLEQSGDQVTGYYGYDEESGKTFSGMVTGNKLSGKFSTTDPAIEWEFEAIMSAAGNSFSGKEYYSNPAWDVQGTRTTLPNVVITDFSGTWQLTVAGEDMGSSYLVLEQSGSQVTGWYGYDEGSGKAFSGTVTGNKLTGTFHTTAPVTQWRFEATMSAKGDSFDGKEYYSNPAWDVHGVKQ